MDEDIELGVFLLERGEEGFDFGIAGDIALEARGARQLVDEGLGLKFHAFVLVTDSEGRTGLVQFLCDAPCDGTLVGQSEDHGRFTCQIDHACLLPPRSAHGESAGTTVSQDIRAVVETDAAGLVRCPVRRSDCFHHTVRAHRPDILLGRRGDAGRG